MIASSNNKAVERELQVLQSQEKMSELEKQNLRLKKLLISSSKEIDLLGSMMRQKEDEIACFKKLHDNTLEVFLDGASGSKNSQSVKDNGTSDP